MPPAPSGFGERASAGPRRTPALWKQATGARVEPYAARPTSGGGSLIPRASRWHAQADARSAVPLGAQ